MTDSAETTTYVSPSDADVPLPTLADVAVTDADIVAAMGVWDVAMPKYAGLLDAEVIGDD